jgi:hypothetical protein
MPIKLNEGTETGAAPIILPEIKKMLEHYRKTMRINDTKSGWISADEIKALLADNKGTGIRIYFGRHPSDSKENPDKQNIILVATQSSDPGAVPTYLNSIDQLNEYETETEPANSVSYDGEYTGTGDDAIPLCPQNCPTDDTL